MNSFIPKSIAALTGFAMILGLALPVSAVELVVVSWGGAYTASQQKAYHDPYMKMNPGVKIINDDSAGDGVAKLRAMDQAGNCLLYTSPSPRDLSTSRMPSSA